MRITFNTDSFVNTHSYAAGDTAEVADDIARRLIGDRIARPAKAAPAMETADDKGTTTTTKADGSTATTPVETADEPTPAVTTKARRTASK